MLSYAQSIVFYPPALRFISTLNKRFQHPLNQVFEFLRRHELIKSLLRLESVPSTVQRPDLVHLGGVVGG